ncbi:SNF2 family N-terminal domain-containing protein [Aspergillus floccosus]
MASSAEAINDVLEDLQLHHVILQSLEEQRPDALEEKEEIVETIRGLEKRLAELRGEPARSTQRRPAQTSQEHSTSSSASSSQLDGPSGPSAPPPRWGSSAMPPPRAESSRSLGPLAIRKRARSYQEETESDGSDDTDDLEIPPAKRNRDPAPRTSKSPLPSFGRQASNVVSSDSEFEGADDLAQILGLDSRDTLLAIQDEQRKAEEWLKERREQERRDAELARRLMEGSDETSPPARHLSPQPSRPPLFAERPRSPLRSDSIQIGPSQHNSLHRARSPPRPGGNRFESEWSNHSLFAAARAQPVQPPLPTSQVPSQSDSRWSAPRDAILIQDSDDSDVVELPPRNFPTQRQNSRPVHHHYDSGPRSSNSVKDQAYAYMDYNSRLQPPQSLYPNLNLSPGPSNIRGPGPSYGPSVLNNTMARMKSGKELFEQIGKTILGDFPNAFSSTGAPRYPLPGPAGYTPSSFGGYPDFLSDYHDADSKKINEEIKQLLETIRPDSDISAQDREGTPESLRFPLLEHQKLGLAWMKSMEEKDQKGGILADDMGLGKTIQAIALMVSRPPQDPERKPTLIIAPVALMQQWKREIQRILRPGRYQLSIYVLHGDKRGVTFRDLKNYDVVLTTFGTLSSELKRREKYDELQSQGATDHALRDLAKGLPCLGPSSKWYRIIIDEAQCIKNRNTKSALAACRLNATYRWCMSGTPMMNNVEELHSLLKFLRIRPYSNLERFNKDFTRPLKSSSLQEHDRAMTQLQVLLKAVLLRRTKESKIDGRPILQLPRRISEKVHAAFSDDEMELYQALETKTQLQFNRYLEAGTVGRNYSNILVLLLRLRQACCHPHLITDFSVKLNANTDELNLVENAKAFGKDVIVRLRDSVDMECPICIDAVENPIIFFPCGHSTCAECFSRISDPALALRQGVDGSVEVKCPNCRGKVDPKKITDHLSFKKVHYGDPDGTEEGEEDKAAEDDDESDDESDDDSDDDNESLSRFIVNDDASDGTSKKSKKKKGKMAQKNKKKTLAELKKEASKNIKSKRKYLRRLEKTWVTSAKIEKTVEILDGIRQGEGNEKTIIFSQFTSLLDLLEVPISRRGWNYRRYDGSMKPQDRNTSVLDFTDDPDCRIMLVSLKAGNSGLNLVAASQVIIFDPFWNPYIEEQAIDRAHRIGQMREVQIHRILVPNTVEDRILELQDKKRELIEGALDEKASKNVSRLGTRELAYLFNIRDQ